MPLCFALHLSTALRCFGRVMHGLGPPGALRCTGDDDDDDDDEGSTDLGC